MISFFRMERGIFFSANKKTEQVWLGNPTIRPISMIPGQEKAVTRFVYQVFCLNPTKFIFINFILFLLQKLKKKNRSVFLLKLNMSWTEIENERKSRCMIWYFEVCSYIFIFLVKFWFLWVWDSNSYEIKFGVHCC